MAGAFYLELLRAEARALVVRYRAEILREADALERLAVLRGDAIAALVFPAIEARTDDAADHGGAGYRRYRQ
jgi:hypothetical protein